ncbi:MAG: type II toxin-antitoxin system death-on-curing family toxin [Nitrospirae bacterium]|nr:type II toxin-antitoxin system death-on-curing family toxin [Nitrospirota bacterium]
MEPLFLSLEEVLQIHADQIKRYGGSPGIRDLSLLESAVATPQAGFGSQYLHADLFEMAAAYLFHIVQNHPFVDGNKRVGTAAALVFLKLSGIDIQVTNAALVKTVLGVAQGKISKTSLAEYFRQNFKS